MHLHDECDSMKQTIDGVKSRLGTMHAPDVKSTGKYYDNDRMIYTNWGDTKSKN